MTWCFGINDLIKKTVFICFAFYCLADIIVVGKKLQPLQRDAAFFQIRLFV